MRIALVAHDARKQELVEWCTHNAQTLSKHELFGTGTTARLLGKIPVVNALEYFDDDIVDNRDTTLRVEPLLSGPLGGDQQIGAMIAEGKIDCLIFFCDNLITQGHQQDVGALVRLASLYNVAFATNRTTADMIMTSPLFGNEDYKPIIPGAIEKYKNRFEEREENKDSEENVDKEYANPESVNSNLLFKENEGISLSDSERDSLRHLGYSTISNGETYRIR